MEHHYCYNDIVVPLVLPYGQFPVTETNPGELELQCVKGGPIFLFRGAIPKAECEQLAETASPGFDLAAAVGQAACMKLEGNAGTLTVFAAVASIGFVRLKINV